jgi:hypothetical protein
MLKRFMLASALVGGGVLLAVSASAQSLEEGEQEFMDRCAVCHGEEGAGDGILSDLLIHEPRNLQLLEAENENVFPYERVYNSIKGDVDVPAHGSSGMPIWGPYLMEEVLEDEGINPKDAGDIVRGRILELVFYIASIQGLELDDEEETSDDAVPDEYEQDASDEDEQTEPDE